MFSFLQKRRKSWKKFLVLVCGSKENEELEEFRRERNIEWVGKTESGGVVFHVKGGREGEREREKGWCYFKKYTERRFYGE